jgi:hypothetical protein
MGRFSRRVCAPLSRNVERRAHRDARTHRKTGVEPDFVRRSDRGAALRAALQYGHPATDTRLGKPKRTGSGRETAILDDSREELEIIKIPQHYPSIFSMIFGSIR